VFDLLFGSKMVDWFERDPILVPYWSLRGHKFEARDAWSDLEVV
jgi:hypothetical protein